MNKFPIERTWYPDYWIDYSYLGSTDDPLEFQKLLESEERESTVVWLPCGAENGLAERFGRPGYEGSLPFLLDEEQAELFLNNQPAAIGESELLLGLLAGLLEMENMRGMPVVPGARKILEVSLERLIAGFGWLNRAEAVLDVSRHALGRFGRHLAVRILKNHLESGGFSIEIFLAWSALCWNEAILNSTEKPLEDLRNIIPRYATELRESGRDDWLLDLETVSMENLQKLGTAPSDHLKGFDTLFLGPVPQLPDYRCSRLMYARAPLPDVIRYVYHPGSITSFEAFGVEESDVEETVEGVLSQAERYYMLNSGGPFLTVLTLQRILKDNPMAGGILMSLALEELHRRISPRMAELQQEFNERRLSGRESD